MAQTITIAGVEITIAPKPSEHDSTIYALMFSSGKLKVGCTGNPQRRMYQHTLAARKRGEEITECWVSPWHGDGRSKERELIVFCDGYKGAKQVPNTREMYEQIPHTAVIGFTTAMKFVPSTALSPAQPVKRPEQPIKRAQDGSTVLDVMPCMCRTYFGPSSIHIATWFLSNHFPSTKDVSSLQLCQLIDASMAGTFHPTDTLIADSAVIAFDTDGVYVFSHGDDVFLKRIQRVPGVGIVVISDNKELYQPYTMGQETLKDIKVHGRVVGTWNHSEV